MDEFVSSSDCEKLVDFHETRVKELIGFNPLICFNKEENLQELLKNDQIKGITSQDFLSGISNKPFANRLFLVVC